MTIHMDVIKDSNSHPYTIRKLLTSDEPVLQGLLEECEDFNFLCDGQPTQLQAAQDLMTGAPPGRSVEDKLVFGIWDQLLLVGVIDLFKNHPGEKIWWLGLLLLTPSNRRSKLGQAALEWIENLCRNNHVVSIQLGVLTENIAGFSFWQKAGFREISRKEGYSSGLKSHTVILMEKSLPTLR
jgi:ribosomal protein S18 acetylase RimI-like enzyme